MSYEQKGEASLERIRIKQISVAKVEREKGQDKRQNWGGSPLSQVKDFGLYSNGNKKLLNGFKERNDIMQFEILNHNSVFCKGNKFKEKKWIQLTSQKVLKRGLFQQITGATKNRIQDF